MRKVAERGEDFGFEGGGAELLMEAQVVDAADEAAGSGGVWDGDGGTLGCDFKLVFD